MSNFACSRTVADRRHARLSQHSGDLYNKIAQTPGDAERKMLQKQAFEFRKQTRSRASQRSCGSQVARGKVLRKIEKLCHIQGHNNDILIEMQELNLLLINSGPLEP